MPAPGSGWKTTGHALKAAKRGQQVELKAASTPHRAAEEPEREGHRTLGTCRPLLRAERGQLWAPSTRQAGPWGQGPPAGLRHSLSQSDGEPSALVWPGYPRA